MRLPLGLACALLAGGCKQPLTLSPRHVSQDSQLIFEQRVASPHAESAPDWESWRLYQSGRLLYSRAGAAPTLRRLSAARLASVRRWLQAHDYELVQSAPQAPTPSAPDISATCQLQLSTGLILAPFGDRRYYACDELRQLSTSE